MKKNVLKCIGTFIAIIFIITGCIKDDSGDLKNKYGFQPPISKLYWGMSLEEVEDTLSIQDGVDGVTYNYDKPVTTIVLPQKIKIFGYKANVVIDVQDAVDAEWFPYKSSYLNYVKLYYSDIDVETLKKNMIKEFDDSGEFSINIVNKECTTWKSQDKINDLEPQILKKLQDYWKVLDEHLGADSHISMVKSENEPINLVILRLGGTDSAIVTYEGATAVPINKVCIWGFKLVNQAIIY